MTVNTETKYFKNFYLFIFSFTYCICNCMEFAEKPNVYFLKRLFYKSLTNAKKKKSIFLNHLPPSKILLGELNSISSFFGPVTSSLYPPLPPDFLSFLRFLLSTFKLLIRYKKKKYKMILNIKFFLIQKIIKKIISRVFKL